jgi:hypothetical protein
MKQHRKQIIAAALMVLFVLLLTAKAKALSLIGALVTAVIGTALVAAIAYVGVKIVDTARTVARNRDLMVSNMLHRAEAPVSWISSIEWIENDDGDLEAEMSRDEWQEYVSSIREYRVEFSTDLVHWEDTGHRDWADPGARDFTSWQKARLDGSFMNNEGIGFYRAVEQ